MKTLVEDAQRDHRAVGAFNIGNMEILIGTVKAAEETNTPIIIQLAEKRLQHSPLDLVAPMMVSAAKHAKVPIAVQLDHGCTINVIRQSIAYGFTSVMFDGSELSLAENIKQTREVVNVASKSGVNVEAELGSIGGSEGGSEKAVVCTRPEDVLEFTSDVSCDALAIAIGNAHGHYSGEPHLQFDVLEKVHSLVSLPLVLHGGSGISAQDFRHAIDLGICKINIATASFDAFVEGARDYINQNGQNVNYFGLNEVAIATVYQKVKQHIRIFNNKERL